MATLSPSAQSKLGLCLGRGGGGPGACWASNLIPLEGGVRQVAHSPDFLRPRGRMGKAL